METMAPPKTTAKRLWHIVRAVFLMLREGLAKSHLFSDLHLHLLSRQGKLAGKSLRSILSNHHHSSAYGAAFSCRYMDPDAAIIAPHEVEFSCRSTPFYAARRRTHHGSGRRRRLHGNYQYDAAAIARAFEILDSVPADPGEIVEEMPTPMPSLLLTPAAARPLRVSDSPFPVKETEETDEAEDMKAEEFIQRFYEQLRRQQVRAR